MQTRTKKKRERDRVQGCGPYGLHHTRVIIYHTTKTERERAQKKNEQVPYSQKDQLSAIPIVIPI